MATTKTTTSQWLFPVISLFLLLHMVDALQLTTTTRIRNGVTTQELQDFISRPMNWPEIVLSSNRVEVIKEEKKDSSFFPSFLWNTPFSQRRRNNVDNNNAANSARNAAAAAADSPLRQGDTVMEYFGPFGQLQVDWVCKENLPGKLVLVSPDGVKGLATNCVMNFEFDKNNDVDDKESPNTAVRLKMEYTPESPLAVLAIPVLIIDNWLALNVLLPAATDPSPLQSFRKLMGVLYGGAGIAHFLDLTVGGSLLFQSAGIPPFDTLDISGQLYALLWCAVGPIAYGLSVMDNPSDFLKKNDINIADVGLFLYGFVEVLGAGLASGGVLTDALMNACVVQVIILTAWTYSFRKQQFFFFYLAEANRMKKL